RLLDFITDRLLPQTAVYCKRWHAERLRQEEGAGSVQSKHQHSQMQNNASLGLEQAWHISPAWVTDLQQEDQATPASAAQIEKVNQNLQHFYAADRKSVV